MLYSKSSAARILNVNVKSIKEVRVLESVILVRFGSKSGKACRFVSKKTFKEEFVAFRQQKGARAASDGLVKQIRGQDRFAVQGNQGVYLVSLQHGLVNCGCEDLQHQQAAFGGKGVCYHAYAALAQLGFSRLADYINQPSIQIAA